jgi:hypothetical protein
MATIDYTKFLAKLYTPEAVFIDIIKTNANYEAWARGLQPGQNYFLIFFYDGMLIGSIKLTINYGGNVLYLSKGQCANPDDLEIIPTILQQALAAEIAKAIDFGIVAPDWTQHAVSIFAQQTGQNKNLYPGLGPLLSSLINKSKAKKALDQFLDTAHA